MQEPLQVWKGSLYFFPRVLNPKYGAVAVTISRKSTIGDGYERTLLIGSKTIMRSMKLIGRISLRNDHVPAVRHRIELHNLNTIDVDNPGFHG